MHLDVAGPDAGKLIVALLSALPIAVLRNRSDWKAPLPRAAANPEVPPFSSPMAWPVAMIFRLAICTKRLSSAA